MSGLSSPAPGQPVPVSLGCIHAWVLAHDDSRIFVAAYLGLAVVLSVAISLFWLVAVVVLHFALEVIRQHHAYRGASRAITEAAWEIRLDVALVLFAFALTLYMDVLLGFVGLQAGARTLAVTRAGARVVAWQRVLRGVILSLDDVAQMARAAISRRSGRRTPPSSSFMADQPLQKVRGRWSVGTALTVALGVMSLALVFGAPFLTDHTWNSVIATLLRQLHPWPG
jgi:hypothetical protein